MILLFMITNKMVDARDRREANKPIIHKVKDKPNFEQWEFVHNASTVIVNTWEFHIDFWPLMFNFKEHKYHGEEYITVTISSKQFKTAPFKLANAEWEYMFYTYAEAFFMIQDFIESIQYENEVSMPEEEY